jgi:hypothetical protein
MKPRADFVCMSKKCEIEGEAPVYELPVDATHCPQGHKRLKRLFNQINVVGRATEPPPDMRLTSSSHLVRSNALLRDGFDAFEKATSVSDGRMRTGSAMPAELAGRLGVPQGMRPSQHGWGEVGVGKPMPEIEQQRQIARDYRDTRVPEKIRNIPPPLKVLRQMNREPLPTRAHRDPRGE